MPSDHKKILNAAKADDNKVRFTVSLTPSVLEEFKEACTSEEASFSAVIESMIKDFLESYNKKK